MKSVPPVRATLGPAGRSASFSARRLAARKLDTPLALAALRAAVASRNPPAGCIHHTDRGCQYASQTYRDALEAAGLRGSMSSVGNPYHNAQAESFMKTLKVEEVYMAGYESFLDVAAACRHSSRRPTIRSDCTQPSATKPPRSSKPQLPTRRLSLKGVSWSRPWGSLQCRVNIGC